VQIFNTDVSAWAVLLVIMLFGHCEAAINYDLFTLVFDSAVLLSKGDICTIQ